VRAIETEEVPQGQGEVQKPERAGTLIGCPIDSCFAALTIMQPDAAKALTLSESATDVTTCKN